MTEAGNAAWKEPGAVRRRVVGLWSPARKREGRRREQNATVEKEKEGQGDLASRLLIFSGRLKRRTEFVYANSNCGSRRNS